MDKRAKFEGVDYSPKQVAEMSFDEFAKQQGHYKSGHASQKETLKAWHAEAKRLDAERTKVEAPKK